MTEANELLIKAIDKESARLAAQALAQGADPNAQNALGQSALFLAAMGGRPGAEPKSERLMILRALLAAGADPNASGPLEPTPLRAAAQAESGSVEALWALVNAGARVSASDVFERGALYYAVAYGRADKAAALISLGADPFKKDIRGESAMDMAKRRDESDGCARAMEAALAQKEAREIAQGIGAAAPEPKKARL